MITVLLSKLTIKLFQKQEEEIGGSLKRLKSI